MVTVCWSTHRRQRWTLIHVYRGELDLEPIEPAKWRLVRMRAEERWPDGTVDVTHVDSLQPLEWIQSQHLQVGSVVTPPLDLLEMGLPADLKAEITEILSCPAIQDGPGRVVVNTVNHLNPRVVELLLEDDGGETETLRATETHKFYSHTRDAWLSARDLQSGEKLEGINGLVTVTSVNSLAGTHRVYNLSVQGEHFYRVAESGVLVHNAWCDDVSLWRASRRGHGADDLVKGYNPAHFPEGGRYADGRAYFARERWIAEQYAGRAGYEDFVTEIRVPRQIYERLFKNFETNYVSRAGVGTQVRIPREFLEALNVFSRRLIP